MSGRIIAALLALALAAGGAAAQQQDLSGVLSTEEQRAEALAAAQDWPGLEQMAAAWSAQDGANWRSWYYYGLAQLQTGQAEQAVKTLDTALKLSVERNDRLLLLIADSHKALADWRAAELAYRDLLLRYPNNADIWDKLREVLESYLQTGPANAPQAEQELADILERLLAFRAHSGKYELWLRYATLLAALGHDDKARAAYRRVLRMRPDNLAIAEWAFAYDKARGDTAALKKSIDLLERLDENNPHLHLHLAEEYLGNGNEREAWRHYKKVSENGAYPLLRAQALARLGDLSGERTGAALGYYKQAIDSDPANLHAWRRIVVVLRARGEHVAAQRYFIRLRQVQRLVNNNEEVPRALLHDIEGRG